jgi:two-component system, sporulation sensor kinase C
MVWVATPEGDRVYFSRDWLEFRGRSAEQETGSGWLSGVHPDDIQRVRREYSEVLRGSTSLALKYRLLRFDRTYCWVEDRAVPRTGPDGIIVEYLGCCTDITGREDGEGWFWQAIEQSDNVFSLLTPDLREVEYLSPAFETVWGCSRAHIIEHPSALLQSIHPADRERCLAVANLVGQGAPTVVEYRILRPDGSERLLRTREWPITDHWGRVVRCAGITEDITERKHAELQVCRYRQDREAQLAKRERQIREMEGRRAGIEQLAATGRLAAGIAHEINNPLAGIKNSFLLIKDAIPRQDPRFDYVERIGREIDHIARIVRQMFYMHRPDQEPPHRFRLQDTVHDIESLLEPSFRRKGMRLDASGIASDLCLCIPEGKLKQVLYNLIINAVDASPHGETVRVLVRANEQECTIVVADRGRAIPEEIRSRLFEPFFSTKTGSESGGLGLGLSASKRIVESLGGTIGFESDPAKGTVFEVRLPRAGLEACRSAGG